MCNGRLPQRGLLLEDERMNGKWKPLLALGLVLVTLGGCAGQQNPPQELLEITQNIGPTPPPTATPNIPANQGDGGQDFSIFANNPYDIMDDLAGNLTGLAEEDYYGGEEIIAGGYDSYMPQTAGTPYPYAGSTPIPLDPVDMPPPPPRAELTFDYIAYNIAGLGVTFSGPIGWVPDESVTEQFSLSEPLSQMKDNQLAILKIYAIPVTANMSESALKTEVLDRLKEISSTNFEKWSPSYTASRHLMGSTGVYANYSGTMANGVAIGGRVHCTCIDKVLYCIEIVFPLAYKSDFEAVFSEMRKSIKRI